MSRTQREDLCYDIERCLAFGGSVWGEPRYGGSSCELYDTPGHGLGRPGDYELMVDSRPNPDSKGNGYRRTRTVCLPCALFAIDYAVKVADQLTFLRGPARRVQA